MVERTNSRPWTEEEDRLLRQGVAVHGENDNWKTISLSIPGRTNKACRKRWLHSLQPNVKKTAWSAAEDKMLVEFYERLGPKWSAIARQIPGRTDDACSKRYREALNPNLKKDGWTPEEDRLLIDAYNRFGVKWGQVGHELNRSGLACRNRWRLLERKKAGKSSQNASPVQPVVAGEAFPSFEESHSHLAAEEVTQPFPVHWGAPYYPPEAYPAFPDHGDHGAHIFREPTPEILDKPDPAIAPFQFSSSSLSEALSAPPPKPLPLPPVSGMNTPELLVQEIANESERQSSLSPLAQSNGIPEMHDILMSLDDIPKQLEQHALDVTISQSYDTDSISGFRPFSDCSFYSASPITIPSELSRAFDHTHSLWGPRNPPDPDFDSPRSMFDGSLLNDDLSSTASTPYIFSTNLSPMSSPLPTSLMDLPNSEQQSTNLANNSLLFSPPNEIQINQRRHPRKLVSKKPAKPINKIVAVTRLSSSLRLSDDPNIRPYACGRPQCWPTEELISRSCFATSAELMDHSKDEHPEDSASDKPYRCAIQGCGKSWKSVNGLQYHLQISTAHFTTALFSKFSSQHPASPEMGISSSVENDLVESEQERRFVCPQPGCYKAYRQPSGLRYHVKNGHPADMPTQLDIVPPALERQMPIKAKKLRPKSQPEPQIPPIIT